MVSGPAVPLDRGTVGRPPPLMKRMTCGSSSSANRLSSRRAAAGAAPAAAYAAARPSERRDGRGGPLGPTQRPQHRGGTVPAHRQRDEQVEDRAQYRRRQRGGLAAPTLQARSSECTAISIIRVTRKSSRVSAHGPAGGLTVRPAGSATSRSRSPAIAARTCSTIAAGAGRPHALGVGPDAHVDLGVEVGPDPGDPLVVAEPGRPVRPGRRPVQGVAANTTWAPRWAASPPTLISGSALGPAQRRRPPGRRAARRPSRPP